MYKDKLAYQPILSANVISLIKQLQENTLTNLQYHNKKAYCKRKGNLLGLVELTIAWEVTNINLKGVCNGK